MIEAVAENWHVIVLIGLLILIVLGSLIAICSDNDSMSPPTDEYEEMDEEKQCAD